MTTPQDDISSLADSFTDAQRRLLLAQAARANATREEIEARGIRPDVDQIVRHMSERVPSHSFKRARIGHLTSHKIYDHEDEGDDDDNSEEARRNAEQREKEEAEFKALWESVLQANNLQDADMFLLAEFRQTARQRLHALRKVTGKWRELCRARDKTPRFDLIGSLSSCVELAVEVCKHLRPIDIVNLYSVSKDFHTAINEHMRSSVMAWSRHMAPKASRVFSSPVYYRWFIPDPAFRRVTHDDVELGQPQQDQARMDGLPTLNATEGQVRLIPGLLWLQMVVHREVRVRDILACLARRGHRLPEGTHMTLTKLWLVMDAATTQARMMLLNNPDFFTNEDLFLAQMFIVKLILLFNDPVFGPGSTMLMRLMLGQRGLSPLWALLRGLKYRTAREIRELKLRYDVSPEQLRDPAIAAEHGVPLHELGVIHFEGWGVGANHLSRPDELVPLEAARRELDLDHCLDEMLIYGHVDFKTGNSLVPSLDEMYMSDEDLPPAVTAWKPLHRAEIHSGCGNVPFEPGMWQPKHARKARWKTLTDQEREMILEDDEEEIAEVEDLDGARDLYENARLSLLRVTDRINRTKNLRAKYRVPAPSAADLTSQLAQFARPRCLRRASDYIDPESSSSGDAMDIDEDNTPRAAAAAASGQFANLTFRPAQGLLVPQHRPQQQSGDTDDLSGIPDEELALDPIPPRELDRIINSFRRPHRPQSETDTSGSEARADDESDEEVYHLGQSVGGYAQAAHGQVAGGVAQVHQDLPAGLFTQPPQPDHDMDEDAETDLDVDYAGSDEEEEADSEANPDNLPHPPFYEPIHDPNLYTPPTTLSDNLDELLIEQADMEYSSEDAQGGVPMEEEEEQILEEEEEEGMEDDAVDNDGGENNNDGGEVAENAEPSPVPSTKSLTELVGAGSALDSNELGDFLINPTAYRIQPDGAVVRDDEDNYDAEVESGSDLDSPGILNNTNSSITTLIPHHPNNLLAQLNATQSTLNHTHNHNQTDLTSLMNNLNVHTPLTAHFPTQPTNSSTTTTTANQQANTTTTTANQQANTTGNNDSNSPTSSGNTRTTTTNQSLALERIITTAQIGAGGVSAADASSQLDPYRLDEDRFEDERTRRLRDWFRPW
ncbi:hypothetical protein VTJ49DRAFT_4818 [Mycothermus thermophilus]|uniref:F-box domain-containing protein n=1 Tax=Humicola insolens TaxID=85995 RepID=A0ABR3V5P2_HUMIN